MSGVPGAGGAAGPSGFRTPFREDGGTLYLIDQRRLPDALVEYPCRSAGEVAYAIREMVVRGAPAIGQVAAIGLALSAEAQADGRPYARKATLRGGANALINSRPTAVNLRWAVERVLARYTEVGELSEDGVAIARRDARRGRRDRLRGDHRPRPAGRLRAGDPADARGPPGPHPDPLQHRAAGLRPVRDRPRHRPGGAPRRSRGPRLGRRDATVPAGRAADDLGAGPGRRAARAAPRCGRRAPDVARRGGRRAGRRGPGRGQRRHRQQGRHVPAGRARRPARDPVLRLRPDQLGRPRHGGRLGDRDRGAQPATRSSSSAVSASPRPGPTSATRPSTSRRPS